MKQMFHSTLFWTKGTAHYSFQSTKTNQVTHQYCHNEACVPTHKNYQTSNRLRDHWQFTIMFKE